MEKDSDYLTLPFIQKKTYILKSLNRPWHQYNDLSPKGSVDERICPLISQINHLPGYVTTSSCAGRISVFVQGKNDDGISDYANITTQQDHQVVPVVKKKKKNQQSQSMNGKGTGGRWLLVSHDPLSIPTTSPSVTTEGKENGEMDYTTDQPIKNKGDLHNDLTCMDILGLKSLEHLNKITVTADSEKMGDGISEEKIHPSILFSRSDLPWIHFKFEPMILHVLTASLAHANLLLRVAVQSGFRESGALNLISGSSRQQHNSSNMAPVTPIVAIRSTGLLLESVVGFEFHGQPISIIPEWQLQGLLIKANERFEMNAKRINKLATLLEKEVAKEKIDREFGTFDKYWENKERRKQKKREEGLRIAQAKELEKSVAIASCELSLNDEMESLPDDFFV